MLRFRSPFSVVQQLKQAVGTRDSLNHEGASAHGIAEVANPNPATTVLVLVCPTDPAARGADLLFPLGRAVDQLVIGQPQVGPFGAQEPAASRDPPPLELLYFGYERLGVEHKL